MSSHWFLYYIYIFIVLLLKLISLQSGLKIDIIDISIINQLLSFK